MKCFLSYNSADKQAAEKIAEFLLSNGIDVWLDRWEIFAGESITSKIEEGIRSCSSFLILISHDSAKANWVKEELRIALQRRANDDTFVIVPVILDESRISSFLSDYRYVDYRDRSAMGLIDILNSIKRVSSKPPVTREGRITNLDYRKIVHRLIMSGARGRNTVVAEEFSAIGSNDITRINRTINHDGHLNDVKSPDLDIVRRRISPGFERWELILPKTMKSGTPFDFSMSYKLAECFNLEQEIWFYAVEAPIDELTVEFLTSPECQIEEMTVFRKEGQSIAPDSTPIIQHPEGWTWRKSNPVFKDTYEFRFKWCS